MGEVQHTRRHVLKTAIGGMAGLAIAAPAQRLYAAQQSTGPNIERLSDDLFVVTLPGETNVLAHTTGGGLVLVDGVSSAASDALSKAVSGLPGSGPVHALFNTHWHPEHTGCNEAMGKAGATIVAQENTRLWLSTDVTWPWNNKRFTRLPKVAQPNRTFYTTGELASSPSLALRRPIRYGYIPDAAHTDGDMYVFFPEQNVLAVGDVVSGKGWPTVDYITGGWIGGLVGGLQRLQTLADTKTRIVPARGPVLSADDLKAQYEMYAKIYDRLSELLNRGRGPSEAVAAKPTKEFDVLMGDPDEFVRRAFESLWGYLSPDA